MDISKVRWDAAAVMSTLKSLPNGRVMTTTGCKIHVPESFRGHDLMTMGAEISVLGYFVILLDDGRAARNMTPSMFRMRPATVQLVEVAGKSYYELTFAKGTSVIESREIFIDDIIIFSIFDEILASGRIPWYYDYDDMGRIFKNLPKYTKRQLVPTISIGEMFIAQTCRLVSDRTVPLRMEAGKGNKLKHPYEFVALRNVQFGANDTLSKIAGARAQTDGFDGAIVNPTESVKPMESLLRL